MMQIFLTLALLTSSGPAHATSRRSLLKLMSLAATSAAGDSPGNLLAGQGLPAVAMAPLPTVPEGVPIETYLQQRARVISLGGDRNSGEPLRIAGPPVLDNADAYDPWASLRGPSSRVPVGRPGYRHWHHPDVLLDWLRHSKKGSEFQREVETYLQITHFPQKVGHVPGITGELWKHQSELEELFAKEITEAPWATQTFSSVFAERLANVEVDIFRNGQLGLTLDEISELFAQIQDGQNIDRLLAFGHPFASAYSVPALEAVISRVAVFAPHTADRWQFTQFELENDLAEEIARYRFERRPSLHNKLSQMNSWDAIEFGAADDPAVQNWLRLYFDMPHGRPEPAAYDRFTRKLAQIYKEHVEVQRSILRNLERNPATPRGERLKKRIRALALETEFELATLSRRLDAFRWLYLRCQYDARDAATKANANGAAYESLPDARSRDWLHWSPPAFGGDTLRAAGSLAQGPLRALSPAWLRSFLGADFSLSPEMSEWLATTAIRQIATTNPAEVAPPTEPATGEQAAAPAMIAHQPVPTLGCQDPLLSISPEDADLKAALPRGAPEPD